MKQAVLEIKHMRKTFGPTVALKDVDVVLRKGEIRGLIGENGSGKSTIMSIASGRQPADSGNMTYMGKPWNPATMLEAQKSRNIYDSSGSQYDSGSHRCTKYFCGTRKRIF